MLNDVEKVPVRMFLHCLPYDPKTTTAEPFLLDGQLYTVHFLTPVLATFDWLDPEDMLFAEVEFPNSKQFNPKAKPKFIRWVTIEEIKRLLK